MRPAPDGFDGILTTSHVVTSQVDVWLGSNLLAQRVPILSGTLAVSVDQQVPERLTITVPIADPTTGLSWSPRSPGDPLAHYGQRIRVSRGVRRGRQELQVQLGWFQITTWKDDGYRLEVEALGLMTILDQARLLVPSAPATGTTFKGEMLRLVDGLLPLHFSSAIVDRTCPTTFAWEDDRIGAVYELADAWPARLRVDNSGILQVLPPNDNAATAGISWVENTTNVIVSTGRTGTRDGVYNAVVANGTNTDDPNVPPVHAEAFNLDPYSPIRWNGPYGRVPKFFASPLLTTSGEALAAAQTLLQSSGDLAQPIMLEVVPDPRVELDDRIDVTTVTLATTRGRVIGYTLPMLAADGAATYSLGVL